MKLALQGKTMYAIEQNFTAGKCNDIVCINKSDYKLQYYFFDIDSTLTDYVVYPPERMLHNNFLFPTILDMMVERGWNAQEAEDAILALQNCLPFWDYTDFISEFKLPVVETYKRFQEWHKENIIPISSTVTLAKKLYKLGKTLFIISNNPYLGCCLKLEVCVLADMFGSSYFRRIFSTDKLRGCKGEPEVWQRAIDQIPVAPAEIGVIGDNPVEDGEIPRSLGLKEIHIIKNGSSRKGIDMANKGNKI